MILEQLSEKRIMNIGEAEINMIFMEMELEYEQYKFHTMSMEHSMLNEGYSVEAIDEATKNVNNTRSALLTDKKLKEVVKSLKKTYDDIMTNEDKKKAIVELDMVLANLKKNSGKINTLGGKFMQYMKETLLNILKSLGYLTFSAILINIPFGAINELVGWIATGGLIAGVATSFTGVYKNTRDVIMSDEKYGESLISFIEELKSKVSAKKTHG